MRTDPAFRLAVSDRRGQSPLRKGASGPLASQPTLSRLVRLLASDDHRALLAAIPATLACTRLTRQGWRRCDSLTVDLDSLAIEVHGRQEGSAWNAYARATIYHPLVASLGEQGDLLGLRLRGGTAHTAAGGLDFVIPILERLERDVADRVDLRIDAGFPSGDFLDALDARGTRYVARLKGNARLSQLAAPYLTRPRGRPPLEPRTWTVELRYVAGSWSRDRRVVLVIQEKPDQLFLDHFFLVTSWTRREKPAAALLDHYRRRGKAEGHFGEFKDVLAPALSSTRRPKSHYRGRQPRRRTESVDPMASNEVILLLHGIAYQLMHAGRCVQERVERQGVSLRRFRETVLKAGTRILLRARRVTVVLGRAAAGLWRSWLRAWERMRPAPS
ncbi:MAG: IS1380 family transposase [Planctomycetes bacterium]|nr:IS1380 family transposase [Planctomycetota bacterium]